MVVVSLSECQNDSLKCASSSSLHISPNSSSIIAVSTDASDKALLKSRNAVGSQYLSFICARTGAERMALLNLNEPALY